MKAAITLLFLLASIGLAACEDQADDRPYVEFVGGGFIFNYNLAQAYYGFVARATRRINAGTLLEAEFEDPSGGPAFVVQQVARAGGVEYSFRSPPVEGVEAERDYQVTLRLIQPGEETPLASYSTVFRSTADQDILPQQPLTVGPAYHPNPDSEYVKAPAGSQGD